MSSDMSLSPVIDVEWLTRSFGKKTALDEVSLRVLPGRVFGLVGENGAGKTTLIKHLLGLLKPTKGRVRVFGRDPVADPTYVLSRVGYLSEERDMPQWMGVSELIDYTRSFYPDWDPAYAEELRQRFDLDPQTKVKHLSRGQRAQLGLLLALAYRPPLLLLDEPSSGLDAVVRREILAAIIRTVAEEGRTVLFSSHLLDEVERVADEVAMVDHGKVVLNARLDEIKGAHHRVTLRFAAERKAPPRLEGALSVSGAGREWTAIYNGQLEALQAAAAREGAEIVEQSVPSLEEVFIARVAATHAPAQED